MDANLDQIEAVVYNVCGWTISDFKLEPESKVYYACRFKLEGRNMISRNARITPKKAGQFVTFWKRKKGGPIEPFHERDNIDFYIVQVRKGSKLGQFVFPRSELIKKGVISTDKKEGKRALRVYAAWDKVVSEQAKRTQKWQLNFFYVVDKQTDIERVSNLYGLE
jgi:hypothetical protein